MRSLPQIDRVLREAIASGDVPGVVAMATTAEEVVYQGAYGQRALGEPAAMTPDTVFWLASMTKAFTSTAAMQLVEQGRLAVDEPIASVLPELSAPQVLDGFDAAGQPILRPARGPITLRHLLTHTSGFTYDFLNPEIARYMEMKGIPGIITGQNAALGLPLVSDPGGKWEYGISTDWLGKVVERVSGQKLGDYFAEHLFDPIGMRDTAFRLTPEYRARLAGMHMRGGDGALAAMEFKVRQEPEFEAGGGGLYGSAADYLAFTRLFLNGGRADGRQVLKPETVRLMSENAMGELNVLPLPAGLPHHNAIDFFPGMVKKWSLGFMISTEAVPGGRSANSLAWAGIANTYFWIDPAKGVSGVILMQLFPGGDEKSLALYDRFEKAVYASLG